jgi:hypothetical protein
VLKENFTIIGAHSNKSQLKKKNLVKYKNSEKSLKAPLSGLM